MLDPMVSQAHRTRVSDLMTLTDDHLQSVLRRMGGDMELLMTLLPLLTSQSQVWVDECDALVRQQDVAGVCRWLHTLRGSLGSLGFEAFCKDLERLERQGRSPLELQQDSWWADVAQARQAVCQLPDVVPSLTARLQEIHRLEAGR